MKRYIAILAIVLAAVACKKGNSFDAPAGGEKLTAHIGGPESRVEFNPSSGKFAWSDPDEIAIHSTAGAYKTAQVTAAGVFTFVPEGSEVRDGYAIYPASVAAGNASAPAVTLPDSYDITAEGMGDWYPTPMIAVNNPADDDLWFYHVGAALRLTLNSVPEGTKTISVSFGKGVTGTFEVADPSTATPSIAPAAAADEVSFVLDAALSEATDGLTVNIPVPAGTYPKVFISALDASDAVLASGGSYKDWTFPRSRGRQMSYDFELNIVGSNLFSVSPVKQVSFSSGNLQNISGHWKFADHQYDRLLAYDANAWDLFAFSTDDPGNNFGRNTYVVWTAQDNQVHNLEYFSGDFVDWGEAVEAQGDMGSGWRTLAAREWRYLLGQFETLKDAITNSDVNVGPITDFGRNNGNPHALRGYAVIYTATEAIPGMVILPDDWTCPAGCRPFVGGRWEKSADAYYDNTYNAGGSDGLSGDWARMEASGAIFLPAAGIRSGENIIFNGGFSGMQYNGYRSSDHEEDNPSVSYACVFASDVDDNYAIAAQAWFGMAVRLVKDEVVGTLENLIGEAGDAGHYGQGTL